MCSAVLIAGITLSARLPTAAPAPAPAKGDLWLGVVHTDQTIEPAFAYVDGEWWREEDHRWRPPGDALPVVWQARLFNGTRTPARIAGGYHHSPVDHLVGDTDLRSPKPAELMARNYEAAGIAVVGVVNAALFTPSPSADRREILRLLHTRIIKAERAEIARAAAASDDTRHLWAHLSTRQMNAAPFKVDWLLSTRRPDGSIIYYLEAWKDYGGLLDRHRQLRVSANVSRARAGALHIDSFSATAVHDDYVFHQPLAILERNGVRCWFMMRGYEDGYAYILTKKPPQAAEETAMRDCDWR